MLEPHSNSPVGQWVATHPQTARVFEALQIDFCCDGNVELSQACQQRQLDVDTVLTQLNQAVDNSAQEATESWLDADLSALCDHIVSTHHRYLREELPRLTAIIEKVVNAHGDSHPELRDLRDVFTALRAELEPHMLKEEQVLFPAIRQLERAATPQTFPFGTVANPIRMMEHEHDSAGDALARIRTLTNDFTPPADACNTYRVMLDSLLELEQNMHQHIHKENNILFPRAQKHESLLSQSE